MAPGDNRQEKAGSKRRVIGSSGAMDDEVSAGERRGFGRSQPEGQVGNLLGLAQVGRGGKLLGLVWMCRDRAVAPG